MSPDTQLAILISRREGFGIPGDLPTRNNNPGDLRHAPGEDHPADAPNSVGSFEDPLKGWLALEGQLKLYAQRNLTLAQAINEYAPEADGNDTTEYLQFICAGLGITVETAQTLPMTSALQITGSSA